jgi:hypothetical protein
MVSVKKAETAPHPPPPAAPMKKAGKKPAF